MRHPAKFSDPLMPIFDTHLRREDKDILDPFAGTGRIHELAFQGRHTTGIEIEAEWAGLHPGTICANSLELMAEWRALERPLFDAVVTSPCYGNRMADHHDARDTSKRNTYRHALGRPLSAGSAGSLQWGEDYVKFHETAWKLVWLNLRPNGRFILNVKDHIRKGQRQQVTAWHDETVRELGFQLIARVNVELTGNGFGANGGVRVPYETVLVYDK